MAEMYPSDIEDYEGATQGEKKVFRFLREAARHHKNFICWYEPSIGSSGKEPDFILFGKNLGLLVIEVKDWTSQQIVSFNPHQFTILEGETSKKRTNPDKQAKGYVDSLKNSLQTHPEFLSDDPRYIGNLKIPIGRMVVFPNISRDEYAESGFKWLIETERALLKDDLDPAGEILCDETGYKFSKRIVSAFPFPFHGITQKEIEKLCFVIWPEVQINLPLRHGAGKVRFQTEVQALDESQARLARRLTSGHQVIKGPPGSGKTLVLAYRCCNLFRYESRVKRILLVCYNIALVAYLKRLVQECGVGFGEEGVYVVHFYELCALILGEPVHYENEEADYYELVMQEALDKIAAGESHLDAFDAIFVDEGQDFDNKMLRIIMSLLKPGGDLVIGLDSHQDLYRRTVSWKSLGIQASGRTRHLKNAYRNTHEIFDFTQRFIGESPRVEKQLALLPFDFTFHGDPPEIRQFQNLDEIDDFLIKDLNKSINQGEYKRSEIAIIYDDKIYGPDRFAYDNRTLPMRMINKLNTAGIPTIWVSQDVRSKEMYDITTDRVSLISIHSSKGLDFDLVYLIGIDHIHPTNENRQTLISLIYVAMTRAKYRLVIPYVKETELIKRMKDCLQ
ncbi:3'-5' exonuclease [Thermodesulfobacteriota bacterium]